MKHNFSTADTKIQIWKLTMGSQALFNSTVLSRENTSSGRVALQSGSGNEGSDPSN
jgi:hypothetical protein